MLSVGSILAVEAVVEKITDKQPQPVSSEEEIKHIATVSANGDETIGSDC